MDESDNILTVMITYTATTPESIEIGDNSDCGFYLPGGWTFSTKDPEILQDARSNPEDYQITGTVAEILDIARDLGIDGRNIPDDFHPLTYRSWYSARSVEDYTTGEERSHGLHIVTDYDDSLTDDPPPAALVSSVRRLNDGLNQ